MTAGPVMRLLFRMGGAFLLVTALVFVFPGTWLRLVAPLAAVTTNAFNPYLESVSVAVEDLGFHAQGVFQMDVTLADGAALPELLVWWKKADCWKTLGILVVAATIWACPACGWRRRLVLFPVVLAAAAWVSAYDVGIEIQETMLRDLAPKIFLENPLAASAANQAALQRLETWHATVLWARQFNEGGGRMLLAVLAGLIGHVLPPRVGSRRNRP